MIEDVSGVHPRILIRVLEHRGQGADRRGNDSQQFSDGGPKRFILQQFDHGRRGLFIHNARHLFQRIHHGIPDAFVVALHQRHQRHARLRIADPRQHSGRFNFIGRGPGFHGFDDQSHDVGASLQARGRGTHAAPVFLMIKLGHDDFKWFFRHGGVASPLRSQLVL